MNMNNQQGQDDPIFAALEIAANDPTANDKEPTLQRIPVQLLQEGGSIATRAYYFSDAVKFRHAGIPGQSPPCLYLKDLTSYGDKTLVYYSSSGSGKTSELAGSSATRGAHLAIVITANDLSEQEYQHLEQKFDHINDPNRTRCGMKVATPGSQDHPSWRDKMIRAKEKREWINKEAPSVVITLALTELLSTKSARTPIESVVQAALSAGKALKLVLSIDEASSCPKVIRGILEFPKRVKSCVLQALDKGLNSDLPIDKLKLEVSVSIGGTGVVVSSRIGSLPANFQPLSPSHEKIWAEIVDSTLSNLKLSLVVPWNTERETFSSFNDIENHLPVVSGMMENGRMGSIAMAALQELSENGKELKEGILAQNVVKLFIGSNGMSKLGAEGQRVAAASALAVHLFGDFPQFAVDVPECSEGVAKWASDMEFFDFATSFTVKNLVQTCGLLEPNMTVENSHRGTSIAPPLMMTPPQQLVALFMLGLELDSMLDPTWFGFELMSTHLVKCAITASLTIPKDKRPSVHKTLELVGFQIENKATSSGVKETWEDLRNLTAVPSPFQNQRCLETRQLNAGLKIVQLENTTLLWIDKAWKKDLMGLRAMNEYGTFLVPPIACVDEGNGSLSNGFVSFFVMGTDGNKMKITIAIQAKDYHDQSQLDHKMLNEHVQMMANKVLDDVLGHTRLMCVASDSSSLFATQDTATKREYMPYKVRESTLLGNMLFALEQKSSQSYKAEKYGCYCDEEGVEIPSSRKRKHADYCRH